MPYEPGPDGPDDLGGLYDRLAPSLFRYALMILADRGAAEDVVQEVFATFARRGLANVDSSEAYVRRAVRNASYRVLRGRRQSAIDERAGLDLETVEGTDRSQDDRIAIEQALRSLPADQREVVHLKVFEGLTFQGIADLTEESINTIASRYRYAIAKLRATLGVGE